MAENKTSSTISTSKVDKYAFDKILHAQISKITGWLSPSSFILAYFDWLSHLSMSPVKQYEIFHNFNHSLNELYEHLTRNDCNYIECSANDHRFKNELWNKYPFNVYSQFFLLWEKTLNEATTNVRGTSQHHEYVLNFVTRQVLDMFSPSNFSLTNPEVLAKTAKKGGMNFVNGFQNLCEDINRNMQKLPPVGTEDFKVGENLAVTPGKVVFRNQLIELIQYKPTTQKVYKDPVLIVPACIMKYYILDLSPQNSMVKYLVDQGHTVFMISWKNPSKEDRDLRIDDYINLGIMAAIDVVCQIIPNSKINATGYCIGGTFLMLAAAAMAGKSDNRLKSITLFAAQVDFKDAGELLLFIDQGQLTYLEDIMWENGYLDGAQMGGAFSMLHATDLIWSRMIRDYLLGERAPLFDLMAWDYDTTRMPYRMHSEYLRSLFLNNDLVEGKFMLEGNKLVLKEIHQPMFVVSTLTDHVAPWQSVYKIHFFTDADITFVLTIGGHNAGIVSEPGHPNRRYQLLLTKKEEINLSPELWQQQAPSFEGSWWVNWHQWLVKTSGDMVEPPKMGNSKKGYSILCDAPGTYVLQR